MYLIVFLFFKSTSSGTKAQAGGSQRWASQSKERWSNLEKEKRPKFPGGANLSSPREGPKHSGRPLLLRSKSTAPITYLLYAITKHGAPYIWNIRMCDLANYVWATRASIPSPDTTLTENGKAKFEVKGWFYLTICI